MKVSKSDITMEKLFDESPDTSRLGTYSDTPGAADKTIDRQQRGDMRRNEFRYFIAAMSGEDTGNPKSVEQDYKRMDSLNSGEWSYVGIRASVKVNIPTGRGGTISHTITSPGLWGIEDDSDQSYFDEVFQEEKEQLIEILKELGNIELVD